MKSHAELAQETKEYDELMGVYEKAGWKWASGDRATDDDNWATHKEKTYVRIKDGFRRGVLGGQMASNYDVIPFRRFKEVQGLEEEAELSYKVGDKVQIVAALTPEGERLREFQRYVGRQTVITVADPTKTNYPYRLEGVPGEWGEDEIAAIVSRRGDSVGYPDLKPGGVIYFDETSEVNEADLQHFARYGRVHHGRRFGRSRTMWEQQYRLLTEDYNNKKGVLEMLRSIPKRLKKQLNKNYRALYQLNWIDDDLELTNEGKHHLLELLLDENLEEFGKVAQAEVKEREEEND